MTFSSIHTAQKKVPQRFLSNNPSNIGIVSKSGKHYTLRQWMLRLVTISTSRPVSLRCTIISRCTIAYIQAFKFKVCKPRIEVRCASQSHIYTYTKLVDAFVPFRAATCALYYIICCGLSQFTASARYIHF